MAYWLKDLEFYSSIHKCFVMGEIIDIDDEDNYVMKNKKDNNSEICEPKNIRKITNISSTPLNECVCEYIKNEYEYIEVEVKETKGLFCILEIEDEEGNISTILSRQKQLRYIEYLPLEDYIREKYTNIFFSIIPELSTWIGSDKFNSTLNIIYENNESHNLFYTCYPSDAPKTLRILCDANETERAKLLLGTAIEKEKELNVFNKKNEKLENELNDVKKKYQEVLINQKFVGLIIGNKGVNINKLKKKYGVDIKIPKNDEKFIKIIISGENGDKVEECAKEINLCEKIFEISESSVNDLKKRATKLMEDYKVKHFLVSNEEKKDDEGKVYKAPNVTIIGNSEFIDELYNNEIKDYDNYDNNYDNYDNNYNNYGNNYSYSSSYRQNNKKYNNNYYNYNQKNYKYDKGKGYNNRNSYH